MKDPDYKKLISSPRWRDTRIKQLRHQPLCERCLADKHSTLATEVHHIKPIGTGRNFNQKEQLAFDTNNLMSLCNKCHKDIHNEMNISKNPKAKAAKEKLSKEELKTFEKLFK